MPSRAAAYLVGEILVVRFEGRKSELWRGVDPNGRDRAARSDQLQGQSTGGGIADRFQDDISTRAVSCLVDDLLGRSGVHVDGFTTEAGSQS